MGFFDRFKKQKGPEEILENGWQFYHVPTTLEPVGTVFRINKDNVRYNVTNLKIPSTRGKEATVRITKNSETGLGLLVKFLNIPLQGKLKVSKGEKVEFELKDPERESTSDVDVQQVLPQLNNVTFEKDSTYYIIRDCRLGSGMKYQLSKKSLADIGGQLKINEALQSNGQIKRKTDSTFEIPHDFPETMRVMFLPAEIKPSSIFIKSKSMGSRHGVQPMAESGMGLSSGDDFASSFESETETRTFELVPVKTELIWKDSDE